MLYVCRDDVYERFQRMRFTPAHPVAAGITHTRSLSVYRSLGPDIVCCLALYHVRKEAATLTALFRQPDVTADAWQDSLMLYQRKQVGLAPCHSLNALPRVNGSRVRGKSVCRFAALSLSPVSHLRLSVA